MNKSYYRQTYTNYRGVAIMLEDHGVIAQYWDETLTRPEEELLKAFAKEVCERLNKLAPIYSNNTVKFPCKRPIKAK